MYIYYIVFFFPSLSVYGLSSPSLLLEICQHHFGIVRAFQATPHYVHGVPIVIAVWYSVLNKCYTNTTPKNSAWFGFTFWFGFMRFGYFGITLESWYTLQSNLE